jgi:hypothetical protein
MENKLQSYECMDFFILARKYPDISVFWGALINVCKVNSFSDFCIHSFYENDDLQNFSSFIEIRGPIMNLVTKAVTVHVLYCCFQQCGTCAVVSGHLFTYVLTNHRFVHRIVVHIIWLCFSHFTTLCVCVCVCVYSQSQL